MKDILCNELTLLKILLEEDFKKHFKAWQKKCGITLRFTGHLLPESLVLLSHLLAIRCPTAIAHGPAVRVLHFFKTSTVDFALLNPEALTNWGIYIFPKTQVKHENIHQRGS
jgi:hypothetical protein